MVGHVADETLVLSTPGRLRRARADLERVLSTPAHPYTRVLLDSIPGVEGEFRYGADRWRPVDACSRLGVREHEPTHARGEQPGRITVGRSEVACIHPLVACPFGRVVSRPAGLASEATGGRREPDAS